MEKIDPVGVIAVIEGYAVLRRGKHARDFGLAGAVTDLPASGGDIEITAMRRPASSLPLRCGEHEGGIERN